MQNNEITPLNSPIRPRFSHYQAIDERMRVIGGQVYMDRASDTVKDQAQAFVLRFKQEIGKRGLTLTGAVKELREKYGFIISRQALWSWENRRYRSVSTFALNYLAHYCGYPSFIHMLPDHLK